MRTWLTALAILPSLTLPALAQNAAPPPAPKPMTSSPGAEKHPRLTMEQRFAQANIAGDGHLTLDEAKAHYPTVARHFSEIDATGKGFVTLDDLRAWHRQQRSAHRPAGDDRLRPRHAYQRAPETPALRTSTGATVPRGSGLTTVGPDGPPHQADAGAPG